jgi:hypothetical protein
MAADPLDELYGVKPEDFTSVRTRLADEAKQRGDAAEAKRIGAARKPTTAAWVVNVLARTQPDLPTRLGDLGERLRAAHASFDVNKIRELSSEQRRLVDTLARDAFVAAEIEDPTAALRDDVTATLQAAVADPEVTREVGWLTKAERWSGFGEFGDATPVFTVVPGGRAKPTKTPTEAPAKAPKPAVKPEPDRTAQAREALEIADATVAAAEQAKIEADDDAAERQADLAAARLRADEARKRLRDAEQRLAAAERAMASAKQAGRDAGDLLKEAKARQRHARDALAKARR